MLILLGACPRGCDTLLTGSHGLIFFDCLQWVYQGVKRMAGLGESRCCHGAVGALVIQRGSREFASGVAHHQLVTLVNAPASVVDKGG